MVLAVVARLVEMDRYAHSQSRAIHRSEDHRHRHFSGAALQTLQGGSIASRKLVIVGHTEE